MTTERAAIMAPSPSFTPCMINTWKPIHTSLPMMVSPLYGSSPEAGRATSQPLPKMKNGKVDMPLKRVLRVIPMGKKNWLFSWTEPGAKHVGIVQSLLATCRLHDINPYDYFVDVLQRVGQHPASLVRQLTPRIWKETFDENPLRLDLHDLGGRRTCTAA